MKWTDQGIRDVKNSPKRAEAARKQAEQMGGKVQQWYTLGEYDVVLMSEFPDDDTAQRFLYWAGSLGNVRTTTLKAWTAAEASKIIAQLP